jgi:hypothetical protein
LNWFSRHIGDDCTKILGQPPGGDLFREFSLVIQKMCYVGDPHVLLDLVHSNFFHDTLEPALFLLALHGRKKVL